TGRAPSSSTTRWSSTTGRSTSSCTGPARSPVRSTTPASARYNIRPMRPTPLLPPDPPLSDGVVTLRVPDAERDTESIARFEEDPEIRRWIFGGTPDPADPHDIFAKIQQRWDRGTDAIFSIDGAGHDGRVGIARLMLGLVDP